MESLKQKTYKAFTWDIIGRFSKQGTGFIISIFLARILSPSDFGMLAMVTVIIGLSTVFQGFGLGSATIQFKNISDEHYGSVYYFNIVMGLILTFIFFLSAGLIADFYNNDKLEPIGQVLSISFVINSFGNVRLLYLRKNLIFGIPVRASLVAIMVGGVIGIAMAIAGLGIWSLVAQHLSSSITNNVYLYFATKWKPRLIFNFKALKELWAFGINMFYSGLLDALFRNLDNVIIGKLFTAKTLGFYFRAASLNNLIINFTSSSLMNVLFPVLSKIHENKEQFKNVIFKSFHLLSFVTFGFLGLFYLTAQDIIVILFSKKWLPAAEYYKMLVLTGFYYPLSALLVNILTSRGNSKTYLKVEIYKKIVIGLNFLIGFWFGIEGFIYGMAISYAIALFFDIYFASKEMNITLFWFYKVVFTYSSIVVVVTTLLTLIGNLVGLQSYWLHGLLISVIYIPIYFAITYFSKLEGARMLFSELKNLNLNKSTHIFRKKNLN